jgi:hypothetical protein
VARTRACLKRRWPQRKLENQPKTHSRRICSATTTEPFADAATQEKDSCAARSEWRRAKLLRSKLTMSAARLGTERQARGLESSHDSCRWAAQGFRNRPVRARRAIAEYGLCSHPAVSACACAPEEDLTTLPRLACPALKRSSNTR